MLTSPTGTMASRVVRCNFKAINNESKYEALIAGLALAHKMGAENNQVYCDYQLISNQVQGEYQVKDDSMIQYQAVALRLIRRFKTAQIPREQNSQAYALANLGPSLDTYRQISSLCSYSSGRKLRKKLSMKKSQVLRRETLG